MKTQTLVLALSLSLFLTNSAAPSPAQSAANLVVPGKSIGKIALGMNQAQVRKLRGKSTRRVKISSTLSSEQWGGGYDKELQVNIDPDFEVTYKSGRVVQIESTLAKFRTKSGLRAGATLEEIRRLVQPLVHSQRSALTVENVMGHEFDGVKMGIAFEMTGPHNGDLYGEDIVNSLIVHRRGVPTISNKGTDWIASSSGLSFLDQEGGR